MICHRLQKIPEINAKLAALELAVVFFFGVRQMKKREWIYLILSIIGLVSTWYFNLQFMSLSDDGGFDLGAFVAGGMANPASSSLTMDITISAIAGFTWMIVEGRKIGMKFPWLYVVGGCVTAFAFAFPFFLFMRERHLTAQKMREAAIA